YERPQAAATTPLPSALIQQLSAIRDAALSDDYAYRPVAHITENIGPRAGGSPRRRPQSSTWPPKCGSWDWRSIWSRCRRAIGYAELNRPNWWSIPVKLGRPHRKLSSLHWVEIVLPRREESRRRSSLPIALPTS